VELTAAVVLDADGPASGTDTVAASPAGVNTTYGGIYLAAFDSSDIREEEFKS
jgi:hypothetical protein